jgi:hypothetical protein
MTEPIVAYEITPNDARDAVSAGRTTPGLEEPRGHVEIGRSRPHYVQVARRCLRAGVVGLPRRDVSRETISQLRGISSIADFRRAVSWCAPTARSFEDAGQPPLCGHNSWVHTRRGHDPTGRWTAVGPSMHDRVSCCLTRRAREASVGPSTRERAPVPRRSPGPTSTPESREPLGAGGTHGPRWPSTATDCLWRPPHENQPDARVGASRRGLLIDVDDVQFGHLTMKTKRLAIRPWPSVAETRVVDLWSLNCRDGIGTTHRLAMRTHLGRF